VKREIFQYISAKRGWRAIFGCGEVREVTPDRFAKKIILMWSAIGVQKWIYLGVTYVLTQPETFKK